MNRKRPHVSLAVRLRRNRIGYLFAAPWLIGFFGLFLLPMIASLLLSFVEWDGISLGDIKWVGLRNYIGEYEQQPRRDVDGHIVVDGQGRPIMERRLVHEGALQDDLVRTSLWNTAYYSFIAVPLGLVVSLLLAMLLNQKLKGISFFRTIFYMPHVIGGIATIMMWLWVFNPDFGLLNSVLRVAAVPLVELGLVARDWQPPGWIYEPAWAKPAVILMALWGAGGAMLIFLAALQNVPEQLYEAARIDGAGKIAQFRHVTVPQISPAIFFNLVMGVIGSFQVFNEAYIMSQGQGGRENSLLFFVLYIYNNAFQSYRMGYASALAWILFVIILAFTMLIVRSARSWVYYEGEAP